MVEIYWLQRLGNIGFCFYVGFWTCVIIAAVVAVAIFFAYIDDDWDYGDFKRRKCYLKKFAMVFAFFTIGAISVPTQHDIMAIYGLGGTIDYIKSNDKAKQLPDKCIDALTRYVDSIEKENKDNNNN